MCKKDGENNPEKRELSMVVMLTYKKLNPETREKSI